MVDESFVGRAGELELLKGMLAGVAAGVGGAVLVEGEQGIGKTALLRRALGRAGTARCALAWGAADELGQRFPLWLMTECLGAGRELAAGNRGPPGRDGPGAGEGEEQAITPGPLAVLAGPVPPGDPVAAGVERLLARVDRWCAVSPVVLVVEDLQWADEASLLVWQRLAQAVGQLPLLLAGSLRPGPVGDELDRLRRGLLSRGGTVVSLGPLALRELSELAGRLAGGRPGARLAEAVRRAGGNPLYTRELVDALARDGRVRVEAGVAELAGPRGVEVSVSLAAVIERRLSALPQEMAGVRRWAAVLGQEFTVTDLAAVTGRTAGQLMEVVGEAVTAGVVGEAADARAAGEGVVAGAAPRMAFRHGLIRQVLYDGMPEALRAALHLQAARVLASAGAVPERVAAQLALVPELADAWVLEWLADAAPVLTYRAPKVAAGLLRGALGRIPAGDPRREVLEAGLVTVAFLLLRDEEVERTGGGLLACARDPTRAAEVAWLVGYTLVRTGRPIEAVSAVEQALRRPGTSEVWTARLHALHAYAMAAAGHPDTAEAAKKALAVAEGADDRFAAGYALYTLCLVDFYHRRHAASLERIEQALDVIGDDPQTTDLRLMLLSYRAHALKHLDRHIEAGTAIRKTLALAERAGTPRMATICNVAAEYYFERGLWDDALAVLEQAAPLPGPTYSRMQVHGLMALIAGHRDGRETAEEHLAAVRDQEIRSIFHRATLHFLLLAQALAAEQAGRPEEAVAVLSLSLDRAVARDMTYRYLLFPMLVRLALAIGDATTATGAALAAVKEAERESLPVKTAVADSCRGLLAGAAGPLLAAAAYYKSASRPLERAQALEDAAVLLAGGGDLQSARQAFGDAVGLYRDLGAQWDIRRATTRLRRHGIRPGPRGRRRAHPATGWEALTPTETKIAYLIARGQSNPDIAAELWLSRNTVQTHVSHILAKLSARSRVEIAREALQHPPAREHAPTG